MIDPAEGNGARRRPSNRRMNNAKERSMRCDGCGNDYDKAFQVMKAGKTYTFDSFECAIHKLAPTCEHCGMRIIGHGLEAEGGRFFCCDHCAEAKGVKALRDRA